MSAYALAKATKLSHPYIMKLEKGAVKEPSYAKLSLIAATLGISVADIFERKPDSNGTGANGPQWATEDPHLRDVQETVLAIKELKPESFDVLKRVAAALKLEAEEEAKQTRRAKQRSRQKLQSDQRPNNKQTSK